MHRTLVNKLSGYPQKLVDLQWLEDELHDVVMEESDLEWNRQRHCAEHRFSDDWEVEYMVLRHWADHVGAKFELTEDVARDGYYHAFIYR